MAATKKKKDLKEIARKLKKAEAWKNFESKSSFNFFLYIICFFLLEKWKNGEKIKKYSRET